MKWYHIPPIPLNPTIFHHYNVITPRIFQYIPMIFPKKSQCIPMKIMNIS